MKKLKSQVVKGHWSTDWWEIAQGVKAIVRTNLAGECSIRVRVSPPNPLHMANGHLPAHWQKNQSTDITRAIASGGSIDLTPRLRKSSIAMQADGVEDWAIEVDEPSVQSALNAIAENYAAIARTF